MIPQDFFIDVPVPDPFGMSPTTTEQRFNVDLVTKVQSGPLPGRTDVEAASALGDLVHDELQAYGTDGGQTLTDNEIATAMTALQAVTKRIGVRFDPPFRNYVGFKSYWLRNDGYGSWQSRRNMLDALFEPLHKELAKLGEHGQNDLADPITAHVGLGWPEVDQEIRELRRRFLTATTPQDYRALGTNCVGVLEALGSAVYDEQKHLRPGETAPGRDKTKQRIGRYIEDALPGPRNVEIRGLMAKAVELAHHVKHSPTSTRRDAGISADSVIMLANMIRRLEQDL